MRAALALGVLVLVSASCATSGGGGGGGGGGGQPLAGCYDTATPAVVDLQLVGQFGQANNAQTWSSTNGTCVGGPASPQTITLVPAPNDITTAIAVCSFVGGVTAVNVGSSGFAYQKAGGGVLPDNAWWCILP